MVWNERIRGTVVVTEVSKKVQERILMLYGHMMILRDTKIDGHGAAWKEEKRKDKNKVNGLCALLL